MTLTLTILFITLGLGITLLAVAVSIRIVKEIKTKDIKSEVIGKYVVARGRQSGCFVGVLKSLEGDVALLEDCRRLWRWYGANEACDLAVEGIKAQENEENRITIPATVMINDLKEIVICTKKAEKIFRSMPIWKF